MPYVKMAPIKSNENCAPTCLQLLGLCSPVAAVCSSISPRWPRQQVPAQPVDFTLRCCHRFLNRSSQLEESFTNPKTPWINNSKQKRVIIDLVRIWMSPVNSLTDSCYSDSFILVSCLQQHHEWPLGKNRSYHHLVNVLQRGNETPSTETLNAAQMSLLTAVNVLLLRLSSVLMALVWV